MDSSRFVRARPAQLDDAHILLTWRNDPGTRRMSLQTGMVSPKQHSAWFSASLSNPRRALYLIEDAATGDRVGMCRFDLDDPPTGQADVSINLAPESRGRGLGRPVLESAIAALRIDHPEVTALRAVIRPENSASIRLFTAVGFVAVDEPGEEVLTFLRDQSDDSSSHDSGVPVAAS